MTAVDFLHHENPSTWAGVEQIRNLGGSDKPTTPPSRDTIKNKRSYLDANSNGHGFKSRRRHDTSKCIVPSRHGGTLNSRRAASPLVKLMEGEKRWEAPDHPRCPPSKLGVKTRQIVLSPAWRSKEAIEACLGRSGEDNCNSQLPSEHHPRPENKVAELVVPIATGAHKLPYIQVFEQKYEISFFKYQLSFKHSPSTLKEVKVKFDSFRRKAKIRSRSQILEREKTGRGGSNLLTPILAFKVTHLDDRCASGTLRHPLLAGQPWRGAFAPIERADKRSEVSFLLSEKEMKCDESDDWFSGN
ncbi:hypothetical protein TNCV_460201 [Trichonephila clavipes]|nr:hypothetical protein TNCV_460201 [Trichonephila clavipes]